MHACVQRRRYREPCPAFPECSLEGASAPAGLEGEAVIIEMRCSPIRSSQVHVPSSRQPDSSEHQYGGARNGLPISQPSGAVRHFAKSSRYRGDGGFGIISVLEPGQSTFMGITRVLGDRPRIIVDVVEGLVEFRIHYRPSKPWIMPFGVQSKSADIQIFPFNRPGLRAFGVSTWGTRFT